MIASTSFLLSWPIFVLAVVHDVQVGQDGLAFTPEALSANPGDQVVFHFVAKNHTATQSSFQNPCGPMNGGFDSGFQVVPTGSTDFPTFTYNVTGTSPVWVYCKQAANTAASHCGAGMVFAINCPSDGSPNSFTNFKKSALAIGAQLSASASAASPTPTAAYGGVSSAPAGTPVPATATISLQSSVWTTTYTSFPNSPDPTPASLSGNVHVVTIGGDNSLTFNPSNITAQPRDIISFQFTSKNHTATQSSFATPCKKLAPNAQGEAGFDSGFMPIANGSSPMVWNVTVNDTAPIWVYCRQTTPVDHCGTGMVFAVNSDETASSQKSFSIFQSTAKSQNGTNSTSTTGEGGSTSTGGAGRLTVSLGWVLGGVCSLLLL